MTLTVLSLFDGISCGRLALDRLGIKVKYYASEIDKYALKVSKQHYPDTIHLGDVRNVRYVRHTKQLVCDSGVYDVGDIDLLIGGSPCQGFSKCGKKNDFEHEESRLIYEFERIRNECRPRYLLLENVNMKAESQVIITDLMSATPNVKLYDLNSDKWVCQHRRRLYWTNIPFNPNDVHTTHPLHLKDLVGDGYEGVRMRLHGATVKEDGLKFKFIPDRAVAQTITKMTYFRNSALMMNGGIVDYTIEQLERLQTLPVGYTVPAGSSTQRSACIGNGWTVAVVQDIFRGMICNGNKQN